MKAGFISEPCYNLVYLELAACRLTSLPADFSRLAPNLRNLNLNYNFLDDVRPLEGLTRMRKLTVIGSRVKVAKQFVKVLRGMLDVEMLDFRYVALFDCSFFFFPFYFVPVLVCFALRTPSTSLRRSVHRVPVPIAPSPSSPLPVSDADLWGEESRAQTQSCVFLFRRTGFMPGCSWEHGEDAWVRFGAAGKRRVWNGVMALSYGSPCGEPRPVFLVCAVQ